MEMVNHWKNIVKKSDEFRIWEVPTQPTTRETAARVKVNANIHSVQNSDKNRNRLSEPITFIITYHRRKKAVWVRKLGFETHVKSDMTLTQAEVSFFRIFIIFRQHI